MTSVNSHCPSCNALVTAGAEWCTLCYADLRPAPAHETEPALASGGSLYAEQTGSALGAGLAGGEAAVAPSEEERLEIEQAADRMLAQLAAESAVPLTSFAGNFQSTGAKVGLIAGGTILVLGVLFGLMALLGSLL